MCLESGRMPDFVFRRNCGNAYDLGCRRNLQQIFGTSLLICFLPVASRFVPWLLMILYDIRTVCNSLGDGCEFPMGCQARGPEEPTQDGQLTESDEELYDAANPRESTPLTI